MKLYQNQVFMGNQGQNGVSTTILVLTNLSKLSYLQLIMTGRVQSLVALKILGATRFSKTIYGSADHWNQLSSHPRIGLIE